MGELEDRPNGMLDCFGEVPGLGTFMRDKSQRFKTLPYFGICSVRRHFLGDRRHQDLYYTVVD